MTNQVEGNKERLLGETTVLTVKILNIPLPAAPIYSWKTSNETCRTCEDIKKKGKK